jgi:hypothetical protein
MGYPAEGEPSPLPWIEDDESVVEALRDVVIPHEGGHSPRARTAATETTARAPAAVEPRTRWLAGRHANDSRLQERLR